MSVRLVPAGSPAGGKLFASYIQPGSGHSAPGRRAAGDPAAAAVAGPVPAGWYDYDPWDADAPLRRAAAVDREFTGDRRRLAQALQQLGARLGGCPEAIAAAGRLADPRSLAVVTGQQAGLLTGPLYTIWKALGATALARELEARLGRPVVPVFWAATEDHDLAEANQAWLEDRDGRWRKLSCELHARGLSVGAVPLPEGAVAAVAGELAAALPSGLWGPRAVELASSAGRRAPTLGEWFCRLVLALLGQLGLVVCDPMGPALRELAAPGVGRILSASADLSAALHAGEQRVRCAGVDPQVPVDPDDVQLFLYPDGPSGPRRALRRGPAGSGFVLAGEGRRYSREELLARAAGTPEHFSGNVVTRPLLQDQVLPTVAYVAGPSEIAYFGQYREAYALLGRTMPVIWPRPSLTLIRPAIARLLEQHRLDASDVPGRLEARREELLRENDPVGVEELFAGLRKTVDDGYAGVGSRLAEIDEGLGRLALKNHLRVEANVAWLERKARQVLRRRSATGLGQLERIESSLWPRRGLQERTANVFGFLARWGPGWIPELSAALRPGPPFIHHFVYPE